MELIAHVAKTHPTLAEDLMRLLNEMELARIERERALGALEGAVR